MCSFCGRSPERKPLVGELALPFIYQPQTRRRLKMESIDRRSCYLLVPAIFLLFASGCDGLNSSNELGVSSSGNDGIHQTQLPPRVLGVNNGEKGSKSNQTSRQRYLGPLPQDCPIGGCGGGGGQFLVNINSYITEFTDHVETGSSTDASEQVYYLYVQGHTYIDGVRYWSPADDAYSVDYVGVSTMFSNHDHSTPEEWKQIGEHEYIKNGGDPLTTLPDSEYGPITIY